VAFFSFSRVSYFFSKDLNNIFLISSLKSQGVVWGLLLPRIIKDVRLSLSYAMSSRATPCHHVLTDPRRNRNLSAILDQIKTGPALLDFESIEVLLVKIAQRVAPEGDGNNESPTHACLIRLAL
jgi:hypothetical protein